MEQNQSVSLIWFSVKNYLTTTLIKGKIIYNPVIFWTEEGPNIPINWRDKLISFKLQATPHGRGGATIIFNSNIIINKETCLYALFVYLPAPFTGNRASAILRIHAAMVARFFSLSQIGVNSMEYHPTMLLSGPPSWYLSPPLCLSMKCSLVGVMHYESCLCSLHFSLLWKSVGRLLCYFSSLLTALYKAARPAVSLSSYAIAAD